MSDAGVASAFVEILPDFSKFGETLGAGAEGPLAGFSSKISGLLGLVPGGAVVAGVAAGALAIGTTLAGIGEKFQASFNTIRAGTGATGPALDGLEQTFKNILASGPDAMSAVSGALVAVSQHTGDTGKALQDLTTTELELARATKTDVTGNITATTEAFKNWGITGIGPQTELLNQLLVVQQKTGVSVASLADDITGKAGAAFRSFGTSAAGAAAIMGSLTSAGVAPTAIISSLTTAMTKAAKGGVDAKTELTTLFDTLSNKNAPLAATQDAITALGARGFASLRDAVQHGTLSLADFTGGVAAAPDAIAKLAAANETLGQKFDTLKNKALVVLQPLASDVLSGIEVAFDKIGDAVGPVIGYIQELVSDFQAGFSGSYDGLTGFEKIIGEIGEGLKVLIDAFSGHKDIVPLQWEKDFENVGTAFRTVFDAVSAAIPKVIGGFESVGGALIKMQESINLGGLINAFKGLFDALQPVFSFIEDHIKPILAGLAVTIGGPIVVIGYLIAKFQAFRDAITDVFNVVVSVINDAIGVISDVIGVFTNLFEGNWGAAFNDLTDIPRKAFDAMLAMLKGELELLGNLFSHIGDKVLPALEGLGKDAGNAMLSLLKSIGDELGKVPGVIVSALAGLGELILRALEDLPNVLEQAASLALQGMELEIAAGLVTVYALFVAIPGKILSLLGDAAKWLAKTGTDAIDGLWHAVVDEAPKLFNFYVDLPGNIIKAIGDLGPKLADFASKAWDSFQQADHDFVYNTLIPFVKGLPGMIVDGLKDLGGDLLTFAGKAFEGFYNGAKSFIILTFFPWLEGLPKAIIGALGNIVSDFFQIGVNIIQGLINGAQSLAKQVGNVFGKIASDAKTAITEPWKVFSPSQVAHEIGQNIGQGFINGIESMGAGVQGAVAKTFAVPSKVPSTPLSLIPGGGASSAAAAAANHDAPFIIQNTFQVPVGVSAQSYADAMAPVITKLGDTLVHQLKRAG